MRPTKEEKDQNVKEKVVRRCENEEEKVIHLYTNRHRRTRMYEWRTYWKWRNYDNHILLLRCDMDDDDDDDDVVVIVISAEMVWLRFAQ